jgi:hypothetical protein
MAHTVVFTVAPPRTAWVRATKVFWQMIRYNVPVPILMATNGFPAIRPWAEYL